MTHWIPSKMEYALSLQTISSVFLVSLSIMDASPANTTGAASNHKRPSIVDFIIISSLLYPTESRLCAAALAKEGGHD